MEAVTECSMGGKTQEGGSSNNEEKADEESIP